MREFALVFREAFSFADSTELRAMNTMTKKRKRYGVEVKWGMGADLRQQSDEAITKTGNMYRQLAAERHESFGWQILQQGKNDESE